MVVFAIGLLRRQVRWSIVTWIGVVILLNIAHTPMVAFRQFATGMPLWFWQFGSRPHPSSWLSCCEPLFRFVRQHDYVGSIGRMTHSSFDLSDVAVV